MSSLLGNVVRLIPWDGRVQPRLERLARAARRYARHREIRAARYPWNAAAHWLRWRLGDPADVQRWVDDRLALGDNSWVFIAGCNNSGTTLLREVLGSHQEMRALPREGQVLTDVLPTPTRLGVPRLFGTRLDVFRWTEDSNPAPALRAKYDWSRYFPRRAGHLLLKSPEDLVRTRWLQRNFSPARFVAIVRSAYAVCEGTRRRSGHSITDAAIHWTKVNECLLEDMDHLQHALLVRYEDFCASPSEHLARIQDSLQLNAPFPSEALQARRVHNIDKKSSGIRNFNAKSLERLSRDDLDTINSIAGAVMTRLGYDFS